MADTLAELQEKFLKSILSQDEAILETIKDSSKENRKTLLSVYQHAYGARLQEFLENDYPVTWTYIGDERFAALATGYHEAHPSDNPNARWFGRHFADFVANAESMSDNPECGEIAGLELALNTAFDAQDIPPLDFTALTTLAPEDWPAITFRAHPSTRRLTHRTNAAAIWAALNNEEACPRVEKLADPQQLIVWRGEGMARYRPMVYDEAMIWDEAQKGATFADLCEMLGTYWPEDEAPLKAAGYLQAWLTSEFLIDPSNAS